MDDAENVSGQDGRYPMERCNRRNRNAAAPPSSAAGQILVWRLLISAFRRSRATSLIYFTALKLGKKSTPALTRGCFYYQHCRQMVATFDFVAVIRRRLQQACYRAD